MSKNTIASVCNQRRQLALYNVPPQRLELQFPPKGYTTSQLDMRRKAEILKYNGNKTNTKTNNLTKAEKYALFANNTNNTNKLSQRYIKSYNSTIPFCPNDISIPTPTSSCDVPGPVIYLHLDPVVPLYKYASQVDSYGIVNHPSETAPWIVETINDISFVNGVAKDLMFVNFTNINSGKYKFKFSTPISIYLSSSTFTGNTDPNFIQINSVVLNVYYSRKQVYTATINSGFNPMIINNEPNSTFSATQYVGQLIFQNIPLYAATGMIYEFALTFSLDIYNGGNIIDSAYNNLVMGAVCNLSSSTLNTTGQNITITSGPYNTYYARTFAMI
jgi:hypothetical protein